MRDCRLLLLGFLLLATAAVAAAAEAPAGARDDALAAALEMRLAGRGPLADVHIATECRDEDGGLRGVEIHGDGLGIWGGRAQFSLDEQAVLSLLEAFQRVGFAGLEESYGGRKTEVDPPSLGSKAARGFQDLPGNLFAEGSYIDVTIRVLDRHKRIQARAFAGMTRATQGDRQKRFEAVLAAIEELKQNLDQRR